MTPIAFILAIVALIAIVLLVAIMPLIAVLHTFPLAATPLSRVGNEASDGKSSDCHTNYQEESSGLHVGLLDGLSLKTRPIRQSAHGTGWIRLVSIFRAHI